MTYTYTITTTVATKTEQVPSRIDYMGSPKVPLVPTLLITVPYLHSNPQV